MPKSMGQHPLDFNIDLDVVWDGLVERGYSEGDIEKIMGGNLYWLYAEVIG